MVHFQQGIINDAANNISTSQSFTFMISRTLIIQSSEVYHVALIQSRGRSLVVTHRTTDVRVTLDRPVTRGSVSVELSTSISVSHAATYVVSACIS